MEVIEWYSPKEHPPRGLYVLGTLVDETEARWVDIVEYNHDQWLMAGGGSLRGELVAWARMPAPWEPIFGLKVDHV